MRKIVFGLFMVAGGLMVSAGEKILLWPEGAIPDDQPQLIAAMTDITQQPDFKPSEHHMPYIEWYEPPVSNRTDACMILISGGGYYNLCDVELIAEFERRLTGYGINCVKLVYRSPRPQGLPYYQTAWEDGQRAVRLVRSMAAEHGVNPEKIGVMGMSAGSNLSLLLATSAMTPAYQPIDEIDKRVSCHINWAVTGAIAYGLTDGQGWPNTRDGDAPDVKIAPQFKFDEKTCPMCMFHGGNDIYSPFASTLVYRQLRRMKIPAELHLYADKPHGFWDGVEWWASLRGFLRQMNFDGRLGNEIGLMQRFAEEVPGVKYFKQDIWPAGKMPDVQTNQCMPYLEWYIPEKLTTKSIQIVYSGGSYTDNKPLGFEVAPFRKFLNAKGMAVVTMKYRVPRPLPESGLQKHVTAWQDLQRAIRIVKSEAEKYGLNSDSIGIMGSSAGGHLTLMGATSSMKRSYWTIDETDTKFDCSANWAVAIYPAYSLTDGLEWANKEFGNEDASRLAPEFSFDLKTCPIIFMHGDDDVWAAMNSVKCWEQLRRMGIQGDLHTLAKRNHCFQREAAEGTSSYEWMDQIWNFMTRKGYNK